MILCAVLVRSVLVGDRQIWLHVGNLCGVSFLGNQDFVLETFWKICFRSSGQERFNAGSSVLGHCLLTDFGAQFVERIIHFRNFWVRNSLTRMGLMSSKWKQGKWFVLLGSARIVYALLSFTHPRFIWIENANFLLSNQHITTWCDIQLSEPDQ